MRRVLYIECAAGAAGDMLLGALIDAGVPLEALDRALGTLHVDHRLQVSRTTRAGIGAVRFEVADAADPLTPSHGHADGHDHDHRGPHGHRSLKDILHLVEHAAVSAPAKARATALFTRLAEVEATVHGIPVADVHLHEVGALDSIIDIVGVAFAMDWLGVDEVIASPLNVGGGTVEIAHGVYPVPAPATVHLLTGAPIYSAGPQVELVTPTGALLVSGYATSYGPMPAMTLERSGVGAGQRDFAAFPNVVRVFVGTRAVPTAGAAEDAPLGHESILKIECEIDDMNPQVFGAASDRLFEHGALDVFLAAVQMKKGRPGTLLTVLAPEARREAIVQVVFRETTTLGVRIERVWRETLDRTFVEVTMPDGPVRVKISGRGGETFNAVPEFDDCLRIALATGRPVKNVQAEALRAYHARHQTPPSR